MSGPVTLITRFARDAFAALSRAWSQVWFQESPTSPLELARIGIGAALLLHYALATPHLFDLWGDAGWMPRDVVLMIRDPWMQSVFFYFGAPWEWVAFHGLFLLCARLHGGLADVLGEMDRASRPDLLTITATRCSPTGPIGLPPACSSFCVSRRSGAR
jgi:hypothetical protein